MPWRRPTNSVRRRPWVVGGLLLTFVTLFAAAVRWPACQEPLWLDELHTGWVVKDDVASIPRRAALGNQSAAYFYLPWLSTRCCGLTPLGLRLPSLLAGICLVPVAGLLAWRVGRSLVAGALAATLVAISGDCVFYTVEARVYALVQCLSLIQVALFVRRLNDARWSYRLAWTGLGAILFYLHYTTALLLVAECLALLIFGRVERDAASSGKTRRPVGVTSWLAARRAWCVEIAGLVAAGLPAAWHLAAISARRANWSSFMAAPNLLDLFDWRTLTIVPATSVALVALLRAALGWSPLWRRHRIPDAATLATLTLIPLTLAYAATHSLHAQLWTFRYLVAPATLGMIVAAAVVALTPTRRAQALAAAAIVVSAWPASAPFEWWTRPAEDRAERNELWRELLDHIEREDPEHQFPILLAAALVEDRELVIAMGTTGAADTAEESDAERRAAVVEFCRFPLRSIWPVDRPDEQVIPLATRDPANSLDESARKRLADAPGGWLIVRGQPRTAEAIMTQLGKRLGADQPNLRGATWSSFGDLTLVKW